MKKFGSLENSERGVWALTKKAREEKDVDPQQVTRFVREQSKITRSKHLEDVSNVDEGLTDLLKRVWEHKEKLAEGFTKKYGVHKLVWYEVHQEIEAAIVREKRLKHWNRDWKIKLVEQENPDWSDLFIGLGK